MIAIVDNSIEPEIYSPVGHWSRYLGGRPWRAFVAREGEFPDPAEFGHIILTGSEASILERDPWVETEAELVRRAAAAGTAVLGSCWGHQLIAYALAGPASVARCPCPEIGWISVRVDKDGDLLGPAGTVHHVFCGPLRRGPRPAGPLRGPGFDRGLPRPGLPGGGQADLGPAEPPRDRHPRRDPDSA